MALVRASIASQMLRVPNALGRTARPERSDSRDPKREATCPNRETCELVAATADCEFACTDTCPVRVAIHVARLTEEMFTKASAVELALSEARAHLVAEVPTLEKEENVDPKSTATEIAAELGVKPWRVYAVANVEKVPLREERTLAQQAKLERALEPFRETEKPKKISPRKKERTVIQVVPSPEARQSIADPFAGVKSTLQAAGGCGCLRDSKVLVVELVREIEVRLGELKRVVGIA